MNLNPLSTNPTKWSNTLNQFVGKLPTNCLSVFDHFLGLALKGLIKLTSIFALIHFIPVAARQREQNNLGVISLSQFG